jgi:hypothetical protein
MAERHAELILTLRDLGTGLDLPPGPDPAAAAVARIRAAPAKDPRVERGPSARWRVAAAVGVVVALVLTALPGPRSALARLLGIGGVEITTGAEIDPDLSRAYDLGRRVPVDEALDAFPAIPVAELGEPAEAFTGRPRGGTSLVWPASDRLPALGDTGAGLILTAFPTSDVPEIHKRMGVDGAITNQSVGGCPGAWSEGVHEMAFTTPDGDPAGARIAGNTLVWTDGHTTYRLESSLDRTAAVDLATRLT